MSQQPLFHLGSKLIGDETDTSLATEPRVGEVSQVADTRRSVQLFALADRLQQASDPLDRAKLATQVRDLRKALVGEPVVATTRAGTSWRELGTALDSPFQPLSRRYGAGC